MSLWFCEPFSAQIDSYLNVLFENRAHRYSISDFRVKPVNDDANGRTDIRWLG